MKQLTADGIILARTDYGEADRILTILTPNDGKLRLIARGVRRPKSKLAGGIELFSVSQLGYAVGRGELGTLTFARLDTHYGRIVEDITRTMLGYECIRLIHKNTEDAPEPDYFVVLRQAFAALDESRIATDVIRAWLYGQLLRLAGHAPNLSTDTTGQRLVADKTYNFDVDAMTFTPAGEDGRCNAAAIKLLRLLCSDISPAIVQNVQGIRELLAPLLPLLKTMSQLHLRTI